MISPKSLKAEVPLGAERKLCSWKVGWKSVLLREYVDPLHVEEYTTTETPDQKIVLVTGGSCEIQRFDHGAWHGASYRPGHIGLVGPGEAARLRWHGHERHRNLQLHIPKSLFESAAEELFVKTRSGAAMLQPLSVIDPIVSTTMLAVAQAVRSEEPELYAETAAHFLASHLLLRSRQWDDPSSAEPHLSALGRMDEYLRGNLSAPVSLIDLARVAGIGRFQLLRMTKRHWGETPLRRLTRMRMDLAQRLLLSGHLSIIEVCLECGYNSPSHFATAFKRHTGVSPSTFAGRR